MLEIINAIVSWGAVFFRAGGMLAKDPKRIKWLVSIGNAGWMLSGLITHNVPLVVSNALCLIVMVVDMIKERKSGQN